MHRLAHLLSPLGVLLLSVTGCAVPTSGDTFADADGTVRALFGDSFSARFYAATPSLTSEVVGPCVVSRSNAPAPLESLSAGEVRMSGTAECIASPNADLEYYCLASDALYTPGVLVTVTATGAAFPAFTAEVVAPAAGTEITARAESDGSVVFAWAGGSGRAFVAAGASTATEQIVVECAVDADAGAITVPASVVAELRAVSATAPFNLMFAERDWVEVEGRRVLVEVGFYGGRY